MKNKLAREILSKCPEEILEKVRKYAQNELLLYMKKKPDVTVEVNVDPYPTNIEYGGVDKEVQKYREQYQLKKNESLEKETERGNKPTNSDKPTSGNV